MKTLQIKLEIPTTVCETWNATDYFCPVCAKGDVWVQVGMAPYAPHVCRNCGARFTLTCGDPRMPDSYDQRQRLEMLRANYPKL